jgi:hypothetical protein
LCVVQALPPIAELNRLRSSWTVVGTNVSNGFRTVVPIATSVLFVKLWNLEKPGGKSYIIDSVSVRLTTAPTTPVSLVMGIWGALRDDIRDGGLGIKPGDVLLPIKSLSGKINYGGLAVAETNGNFGNFSTTDWHLIGRTLISANTADLTLHKEVPLEGRYIVRPGGLFGIVGSNNAAIPGSNGVGQVWWHEVQLPLGT